jgi:hypothetical protein
MVERHGPELVVIGVHAAKCSAERDAAQLRTAVQRHGIAYPVVNDRDMEIWRRYQIEAWPTSILIDTSGRITERVRGEGVRERLDERIATNIRDSSRSGGMRHDPLAMRIDDRDRGDEDLSFPGAILADERSRRLFISDTNANRIVVADFEGNILQTAGSGEPGLDDGNLTDATFNHPQGLVLDGNVLYVADRRNHCVRSVDLANDRVRRTAGTGDPAPAMMEGGPGMQTELNSPWDLTMVHHRLYITMAGANQLWRQDVRSGELEPYAGANSPGLVNGSRAKAQLAQPSAITHDGMRLFFTDAGSSAVRWVYLPPGVQLGTWVGRGIFEYGDRDGPGQDALLQYPLGLDHHGGNLYIADTYNNKIKLLNPRTTRVTTLLGTGEPGHEDGATPIFNEPRDLSVADDRIWIADTNNHAIRVAPVDGGPVSTLQLRR